MQYIIVESKQDRHDLQQKVNDRIKEGYVPQGGVYMNPTTRELFQAMVTKEN